MRRRRHGARHHHRAGLSDDAGPPPATAAPELKREAALKREVSLKLSSVARALRTHFDRAVEGAGITRSQWMVVAVAHGNPGSTQRSIAERLEMSEAAAGRLIDRLCADGLLVRRPKEDDRRAYRIETTGAAKPLLDRVGEIARANEKRVFAEVSAAELEAFRATLDVICRNMAG